MNEENQSIIDVSVDIETMSLDPDALVISIGACTSNARFHHCLNFKEQLKLKRSIDADTLTWHMENHSALFIKQLGTILRVDESIFTTLSEFNKWFKDCIYSEGNCQVWMNSPSFDSVILKNLAIQLHCDLPWMYKQERDLRTIKALAKARNITEYEQLPPPPDNAHDALVDAKYQLEIISRCKTILNC